MSTIHGINISDASIEVASIKKPLFGKPSIVAFGRQDLSDGVVRNGEIIDAEAFTAAVKQLLGSASPKPITDGDVVVSIPESQMYARSLQFPAELSMSDIRAGLQFQITKYIPFEESELCYDALPISTVNDTQEVMAVAVPKKLVDGYTQAIQAAGVTVERVTLESLTTAQAIVPMTDTTKMLVDLGSRTTNVSVFKADHLLMSVTIPVAGEHITQALMEKFEVTRADAEDRKQKYGVVPNARLKKDIPGQVKQVVEPLVDRITEIMRHIEERYGAVVESVVLTGGTSQLPGLDTWLQEVLEREIIHGKLLIQLRNSAIIQPNVVMYHNAIGLGINHLFSSALTINLLQSDKGGSFKLMQRKK